MVFSVLFNSFLHETRQRRQNVNWRVDLFIVQRPVNEDLALGDVASKIRNGVSDVVVLSKKGFTGIDRMGI